MHVFTAQLAFSLCDAPWLRPSRPATWSPPATQPGLSVSLHHPQISTKASRWLLNPMRHCVSHVLSCPTFRRLCPINHHLVDWQVFPQPPAPSYLWPLSTNVPAASSSACSVIALAASARLFSGASLQPLYGLLLNSCALRASRSLRGVLGLVASVQVLSCLALSSPGLVSLTLLANRLATASSCSRRHAR